MTIIISRAVPTVITPIRDVRNPHGKSVVDEISPENKSYNIIL